MSAAEGSDEVECAGWLGVLVCSVGLFPVSARGQQDARFDLVMARLELSLDLDYQDGSLHGAASYTVVNHSPQPVSRVPFNLGRLMQVHAARRADGTPLAFTQDVAVFSDDPRRQVDHVVVDLPAPLDPDSAVSLRLEYGGFLVGYAETGSLYVRDRVPWASIAGYVDDGDFSILRTDAYAWPVLGTSSRSANRAAPRADFTYHVSVTVPQPHVVASGGHLVSRATVEGRTTFVYESVGTVPFLNLPIADYVVRTGRGVRVYHFPADSAGGRRVLEKTRAGLDLLASWFGPLSTRQDVVIMEIPEGWGSQASLAGGIIQTADAFGVGSSMTPLYHEISHLWNAPDRERPSARWNEGLATFLQLRMASDLDGADVPEAVRRIAKTVLADTSRTAALSGTPFVRYGEADLTDLSYRVGCLMFYALYTTVGPDTFDDVIRAYRQANEERGWTFQGLTEAFQQRAGPDLTGFFRDWVFTTGWFDQLRAGVAPDAIGVPR